MKRKSVILTSFALILMLGLLTPVAHAYDHGKSKGCCGKGHDEKVFHKAYFILKNQEELGLTDEQVQKIKDLKLNAKKDLIKKKADIELVAVDIKAAMWQDAIDTEAIYVLIDKKYELKKEKAKSLLGAYVELKGILTEEQKGQLKDLWRKCKIGK